MTCIDIGNGFVCVNTNRYNRLRLSDGGYVYMDWHSYLGPTFYKDRAAMRELEEWYEDDNIVSALTWFVERGNKS